MPFELILGRKGAPARKVGFGDRPASGTGELITYSGDGHLVTFASTGAGKTSGPVICNALTHKGQLIVIDIKGEIYGPLPQHGGRWVRRWMFWTCGMENRCPDRSIPWTS
jgi:type IV secretory pathway TraG/TraD family ATPase VirD4